MPLHSGIRSRLCAAVPRHAWLCLLTSERHTRITWWSHFSVICDQTAWIVQTSLLKTDLSLAAASSCQGIFNFQWGGGLWSGTLGLASGTWSPCSQVSCWSCTEELAWSVFPSDCSFVWLSVSIVPVLVSVWMLLSGTLYLFHWQKCWMLARLRATPVESHQKYFHLIEIPHWCLLLTLSFSQFLIHLIYAWIKSCSAVF